MKCSLNLNTRLLDPITRVLDYPKYMSNTRVPK
jgi:hypothetical protein